MTRSLSLKPVLAFVLALALAWAPVLPSFAMSLASGDADAAHASHHGHDGAMPDHAAPKSTPCTQHDACNGQCCDFCAQCFSAVAPVSLDQVRPHPVRTPALARLHSRVFSASPDRPPRFLSL